METTDEHRWTQILAEKDDSPMGEPAFHRIAFLSVFICTTIHKSLLSLRKFLPQRTQRAHREAFPSLRSLRSLRLSSLVAALAAPVPTVVSTALFRLDGLNREIGSSLALAGLELTDDAGWIARDDCVRRHVFGHDGTG